MKPRGIKPVVAGAKVNICVFGIPGSGKTRLAGSSGKRTLILRPPTDHTDSLGVSSGVDEWIMRDWDDMNESSDFMRSDEAGKMYDWIWLDSISLFQDTGLDHIWADTLARKPDRGKYGLDKAEYGINMFRLGQWVRHVVGMEAFNFGITAHQFETTDVNDDPVCMPWVQGNQMAEKICGYMNVVGHLEGKVKNGQPYNVLNTRHEGLYYAKDQYNKIGKMVNPTIPKIMAAINGAAKPTARRRRTTTTQGA